MVFFYAYHLGFYKLLLIFLVRVYHNHNHYYNMMHYQLKFKYNLNINFMVLNQIERILMEDCSLYIYIDLQNFVENFQFKNKI